MKFDATHSPQALQMPQSLARHFSFWLVLLGLFAAGMPAALAKPQTPAEAIIQLSQQPGISRADYAAGVADIVSHNPGDAAALIALAIKSEPKDDYACDVMKECILALLPPKGTDDENAIAAIVVEVVKGVQVQQPGLVRSLVECATNVDQPLGALILTGLQGLYTGPNGFNRPPGTLGPQGAQGGTPPPKGTPPPTNQPPVSDVQNK